MLTMTRILILLALMLPVGGLQVSVMAVEPDLKTFKKKIEPILRQYCYECHGPDGEASPRMTLLDPDLFNGVDGETWHDALNRINEGKMPPKDAVPLPSSKRKQVVAWLQTELDRALEAKRSTGGRVVFRRLTKYEYNNTMRDLLGIDYDFAENLPPESRSEDGFLNNGQVLSVSPLQIEYYLQAARKAMSMAIVTGPAPEVVKQEQTESAKGARDNADIGKQLDGRSQFIGGISTFPRQGRVRVTVKAYSVVPDGKLVPQMQVNIGIRSDTLSPSKPMAVTEVTGTKDAPQTFVFEDWIQKYPLPGKNPKFPGIQIRIKNLTGKPLPKPQKGKPAPPITEPVIVVESVSFEGPISQQWPPSHHQQILPPTEQHDDAYVSQVIGDFMRRAYRRPVSASEQSQVVDFYHQVREGSASFEEAIRETFALVLVSPDFLYMVEPVSGSKRESLTDHELATRLSYFLWSSMPDAELFRLADNGRLDDELGNQIDRMLDDPRSEEFVRNFVSQWLDLSGLTRVAVNPEYYPKFNDDLKSDMAEETIRFFAEVLYSGLSAENLLRSDFAVVNAPLASHYGLENKPAGHAFQRIALNSEENRGGLLTQGSFLLINSNGEDSHPIRRAVWILDRLLDDPPSAPPPDVPELDSEKAEFAALSIREQLELHREKESCNSCHKGIDPWGIPLQNFDAVGKWRTEALRIVKNKSQQVEVEAMASLPEQSDIDGVQALQDYLLTYHREEFARALVTKLTTYALGRRLELTDKRDIDTLTDQFLKEKMSLEKLISGIVQSQLFQTK